MPVGNGGGGVGDEFLTLVAAVLGMVVSHHRRPEITFELQDPLEEKPFMVEGGGGRGG